MPKKRKSKDQPYYLLLVPLAISLFVLFLHSYYMLLTRTADLPYSYYPYDVINRSLEK